MLNENPFKITTPEDLTADETVKLFVDIFTDFRQITDPENVIIKGPRGTGKSMMLRYLEPDCQCMANSLRIEDLPYIAIYIPLKNTNFSIAELKRFDNKHATTLLNEHLMITHCLVKVFSDIRKSLENSSVSKKSLLDFYNNCFLTTLSLDAENIDENVSNLGIIDIMVNQLKRVYLQVMDYFKRSAFTSDIIPYPGPLYDYNDYLVPLIESLSHTISNLENGVPFFLLLDDAHFLSETQTKILNTWVASRSSRKVSLKISTQYNYKTYYTINGATIDTPHDYAELDIATIYTEGNKTAKSTYYGRISSIVKKRLDLFNINVSVQDFFPFDKKQEEQIEKIKKIYIEKYDKGEGYGSNRTDDANRYARPDFIKSLGGTSKSSYTYSYAGFDQLVNISSGIVRYFLQQAHSMYAKQQSKYGGDIKFIDPAIQNDVVRDMANAALFNELDAYTQEGHENAYPKEDIKRLSNLIQGLGTLFRKNLLSNKKERRVFSVAISDCISEEVENIFDIGLQLGYFHRSTIGRKNAGSIGRLRLYVLNRRLAPIWNLDPNGFAGYLFVKNKVLEDAILDPLSTEKYFDKRYNNQDEYLQLNMFDMQASIENGDEDNE